MRQRERQIQTDKVSQGKNIWTATFNTQSFGQRKTQKRTTTRHDKVVDDALN